MPLALGLCGPAGVIAVTAVVPVARSRSQSSAFRLRVGCSASTWTAPDGSSLLTLDASSVQTAPDGSRRIVWMINGMIKAHPTENGCQGKLPDTGMDHGERRTVAGQPGRALRRQAGSDGEGHAHHQRAQPLALAARQAWQSSGARAGLERLQPTFAVLASQPYTAARVIPQRSGFLGMGAVLDLAHGAHAQLLKDLVIQLAAVVLAHAGLDQVRPQCQPTCERLSN